MAGCWISPIHSPTQQADAPSCTNLQPRFGILSSCKAFRGGNAVFVGLDLSGLSEARSCVSGASRGKATPEIEAGMTALRAVESSRLDELAAIANAEYGRVWRAGREALEHAVKCGEALLEAQGHVERGEWLRWLTANVTVHPTSAYKYMRLARHKDRVLAPSTNGVEAGLRLVAAEPWHDRARLDDEDKEQMVALVREHGLAEVAERFGCSVSTVSRWTSPRSPARFQPTPIAPPRRQTIVLELRDGITDEMIERVATWLCERYGGTGGVTDAWRQDAVELLGIALNKPDASS